MTPRSAHDIAHDFLSFWIGEHIPTEAVEQLLEDYAAEAIKEDRDQRTAQDLYQHSYERGKREQIEKDAKIAEEYSVCCVGLGEFIRRQLQPAETKK